MKKKCFLLMGMVFLVACNQSVGQEVSDPPQDVTNQKDEEEEKSHEENVSLDEQFIPPNFMIDQLTMDVQENEMAIQFDFTLSQKLYDLLRQYEDYYFVIEYPGVFHEYTGIDLSKPVTGPIPNDEELSYHMSIRTTWDKRLSADLMNELTGQDTGYNLLILDREYVPVHEFKNIQEYRYIRTNEG